MKLRQKQAAERALARAIIDLKTAREKEKTLVEEKEKIVERWIANRREMAEAMNAGGKIFDGTVHLNFLRKLKEDEVAKEEEIEEQRRVIERCEEIVRRRKRDYIDAAKALQVMEKHKALWHKRVTLELTREEEKRFDELAGTIHQLRKWRGGEELS